jgi:type I restriction-modification system DNA methylase subunit
MFKALGWDIDNEQGHAEAYKDVIHEDAIKVGGATKAPDYCFRVGGTRKFFLEAKKPSVNISQDEAAAFQLRRYAWSAKLPLSILTDFEEFIVYDCRLRPNINDKASKARVISFGFKDYLDRWEEIVSIFSRDAVLKGSFDKYAESSLRKRGTAEVDEEFLAEIETWRELLARNIALRNRKLTARELNFAVQLTIDRIIFLRICEDRGIESYGRLKQTGTGSNLYDSLFQLFHQADQRYNSGLFHFRREKDRASELDTLTPNIKVDDKPLKEIIRRLYYPESPYEFAVLPADILGHIYEQFLGKVISLTKGHQAKIEEKPEVRKAGGVYYTPTYIVDYIVKNTVGKLLEDRTAGVRGTASKLRVLDPACGSGSFLLGAYQYLLDWHLEQYVKDDPKKWTRGNSATIFQDRRGEWRLTTSERKRILLNSIYGVDIDSQAVEVTKLSLLLKVLEEESSETIEQNLKLFHERALPDLGNNIKCGNSLIAPDFYEGWQSDLFDAEERYRVNAFDWKTEFSGIVKAGGFDAVIGNPPYIQSRSGALAEQDKSYFAHCFKTVDYQINTYGLFLEKSVALGKQGGLVGMIVPNYWLSTDSDRLLRKLLFADNHVSELINVYRVFRTATVDTLIVLLQVTNTTRFPKRTQVRAIDRSLDSIALRLQALRGSQWAYQDDYVLEEPASDVSISFRQTFRLKADCKLGEYFEFKFGMKPYELGKGKPLQTRDMIERKVYHSDSKSEESFRPLIVGRDVKRYALEWGSQWIKYGENLAAPRDPAIYHGSRILLHRIMSTDRLNGTYTALPYICSTDIITLRPKFAGRDNPMFFLFLGIILSQLCAAYLKSTNVNLDRSTFPKINANTLESFPVPKVDADSFRKGSLCTEIALSVRKMLKLNEQLNKAKTEHDRNITGREIESTDKEIDRLVCNLYELTDEEAELVRSVCKAGKVR